MEDNLLWEETVPLMVEGYHRKLVDRAYASGNKVFPLRANVFASMQILPFNDVKVVIIGQDPYFNEHKQGPEAHGLSFSVQDGIPMPPSLRNIFAEVNRSIYNGEQISMNTDLTRWAKQGVLLLNSTLTVVAKKPNSHSKLGWQTLTDNIIETLSKRRSNLVFLLWGAYAQKKANLIDHKKHRILTTSHPSPLSAYRGFNGSDIFLHCNSYLSDNGVLPITW